MYLVYIFYVLLFIVFIYNWFPWRQFCHTYKSQVVTKLLLCIAESTTDSMGIGIQIKSILIL